MHALELLSINQHKKLLKVPSFTNTKDMTGDPKFKKSVMWRWPGVGNLPIWASPTPTQKCTSKG